jgi:phosphoribosylanthranilate isomerase
LALVDAMRAGEYGGTGQTLDWPLLAKQRAAWRGLPLVLAGGLKPDNVAEAIAAVRPWAVDVASGVEASPGRKSGSLVRQFVAAARKAFAENRL